MPEKVEREAQLIFMCLQKKLNKRRKKDEGENGSLGKSRGEERRSVLMISSSATEAKLGAEERLQKESYVSLRKA